MSIETEEELRALEAAGRAVAATLRELRGRVRPGVSTGELDRHAAAVFARHGARSGPALDYGFPGTVCISVNDEAVHGVPGPRRLRAGDLVKLDVTAELDGFYADACVTVPVGRVPGRAERLVGAARAGLRQGLAAATAGARVGAIGTAVEGEVLRRGFAVCHELQGHGIGRRIHEPPDVPNVTTRTAYQPLTEGLVITIEPIVSAGSGDVVADADGWPVRTADGSLCAHFEHTLVIRRGAPLLLTA